MQSINLGSLTVGSNGNELENLNIPAIKGDTGNGIKSITYDRTEGATRYYTVLYTDGNTDEISVQNGIGDMLKYIYDSNSNGIVDNAEKVNNHTVEKDVPVDAKFTDTIYDDTQVKRDIQANSTAITNLQNAGYITKNVNDLTNYTLTTNTGSQIALNINSSDFKMTAILKDKNGNIIYTSNIIDLPLETMVVGASYDNTTKEVVLTLQNGTTTRFSVADLVDGLVNQSQLTTILASYYNKTEIDSLLANIQSPVVDTLSGDEHDKSPSVNIINSVLGALANLTTTAKDNLVNAINELKSGLGNKVDKVSGKGLSTNDFTTAKSNQIETNKTNIANLTPATSYSTSTAKPYSCSYMNNLETYSTSEKKIGKWIDGKPLYRKVISQSNKNDVSLSSLNYNYLAVVYSIITIKDSVPSSVHPYIRIPYYTSGTDYFRVLLVPEGKLRIETSASSILNWTTVIEYTKTTD